MDQCPNSQKYRLRYHASVEDDTKPGAKCAVHKDENCFSLRSDLGPRRLCAEKYVTVMSTVSGCDVTTVCNNITRVQQAGFFDFCL